MNRSLLQRSALEGVGTALLAFSVGSLGIGDSTPFQQAMGVGLCIALLIHLLGRFSGAHLNPAVTILLNHQRFGARALFSSEAWRESLAYIAAQIAGALIGLALHADAFTPGRFTPDGLIPELVFSGLLFALILRWSDEGRICPVAQPLSGLVVGAGVGFLVLLGSVHGSGIYNPALAIGFASRGADGLLMAMVSQLLAVAVVLAVMRSGLRLGNR